MDIYKQDLIKTAYACYPYTKRFNRYYAESTKAYNKQPYEPLISAVIPVYNVLDNQLKECIDSIINQTYPNWELYLIDDNSSWESVRTVLGEYEQKAKDTPELNGKINVIYRKENGHISKATNDGIFACKGEFIAFMDCDDFIEPYSFAEMVYYLNEHPDTDFIYSDEDKVDDDGVDFHFPFFKPDWSPDIFLSMMFTNHLAIYRREIVVKVGGLRTECNGSQDYDLTLRFMEHSDNKRVGHVPKVLYHWRERPESAAASVEAKPYAIKAAGRAKQEAIERRGLNAELEYIPELYQYRLRYIPTDERGQGPAVSIIIPSKDNPAVLCRCLDTLVDRTIYKNYRIIVVDNGSEKHNRAMVEGHIASISKKAEISYIYEKMDFNFSKMCNIGAKAAESSDGKCDYLLFLNDDIEIMDGFGDWLDRMLGQAMQEHTGAVGAKLLYSNRTIQHIGIVNIATGPAHAFMTIPDALTVNFNRNKVTFNWIAVTGACLMVSRDKFNEVGGFDEELTVSYNDVDLCFKLYEAGYYNAVRTDAALIHHESVSRGIDALSDEKTKRLTTERNHLFKKHPDLFGKDPFYNPNLAYFGITYEINMYDVGVYRSFDIEYDEPSSGQGFRVIRDSEFRSEFRPKKTDLILSVDVLGKTDTITVSGWAASKANEDGDLIDLNSVRYVMLKNKVGQMFFVPADKMPREQVAEKVGLNNLTEGFECKIDRKLLATNVFDYQVGILQINDDGRDYIWSDKVLLRDGTDPDNYVFYSKEISEADFTAKAQPADNLSYNVDELKTDTFVNTPYGVFEEMTYITGWALPPKGKSYDYVISVGVKYDDNMKLYDTIRLPRYDVATSLRKKEAYLCGFKAEVPTIIDADANADVYLILTNIIDGSSYYTKMNVER